MNPKPNETPTGAEKTPVPSPRPDAATPVDLEESVAGEEDPGASLDMAIDTPAPSPEEGSKPTKDGRSS
jgi:hypothetical protein